MAATPIAVSTKDPNETLDYTINWAPLLDIDTITALAWTVPVGITDVGEVNSTKTTTIWLAGGSTGSSYPVTCRITTQGGRILERSFQINVVDK